MQITDLPWLQFDRMPQDEFEDLVHTNRYERANPDIELVKVATKKAIGKKKNKLDIQELIADSRDEAQKTFWEMLSW